MIFITVGGEKFPFNRLMLWLNVLLAYQLLPPEEEIIVHSGACTVIPEGIQVYPTLTETKLQAFLQQARLIVGHCSAEMIARLEHQTQPFILVPRSHRFEEQVDDHQVEIALKLAQLGVAIAWSPADLLRFCHSPVRSTIPSLSTRAAVALCQSLQTRFEQASLV